MQKIKPITNEELGGTNIDELIWLLRTAYGDKCWLWPFSVDIRGRGTLWIRKRKMVLASRAVFLRVTGSLNGELHLCHHCDIVRCVNPGHLYEGTHQDNMADMVERRRYRYAKDPEGVLERFAAARAAHDHYRGEANPAAKLTREKVEEIRSSSLSREELSKKYGVCLSTVGKIKRRETWI